MTLEYMTGLWEEGPRTAYTVRESLARAVMEGWRVHTWTVLHHKRVSTGDNHGHSFRNEMTVSVLLEREVA